MAHVNQAFSDSPNSRNARDSHRLHSLSNTLFVKPKHTGVLSVFIQAILFAVSLIFTFFLFYHVGGYEYTHWNENSTILEPINHNINRQMLMKPMPIDGSDSLVSTKKRKLDFSDMTYLYNNDSFDIETVSLFLDSAEPNEFLENATFGIEQVPLTTVIIGNIEFDWLEVIRISTLLYVLVCMLWFLTGVLFIATIKCEILDPVVLNTTILILVVLLQTTHSGLGASLIFFQREMSWRTFAITAGSTLVIFGCAFLGVFCVALNFGWIRYIDYMHGRKKCTICSIFNCCGRSNKQENSQSNGVNHHNGQYENDVPLDRFDAF